MPQQRDRGGPHTWIPYTSESALATKRWCSSTGIPTAGWPWRPADMSGKRCTSRLKLTTGRRGPSWSEPRSCTPGMARHAVIARRVYSSVMLCMIGGTMSLCSCTARPARTTPRRLAGSAPSWCSMSAMNVSIRRPEKLSKLSALLVSRPCGTATWMTLRRMTRTAAAPAPPGRLLGDMTTASGCSAAQGERRPLPEEVVHARGSDAPAPEYSNTATAPCLWRRRVSLR